MLYELEDALDSLMFRWSMCLNNNRDYFADEKCHSQIQQLVQTGLEYLHQIGCGFPMGRNCTYIWNLAINVGIIFSHISSPH